MPTPKKPRANCLNCGKETPRPGYKYCSNKCQGDLKVKNSIKMWLSGKKTGHNGKALQVAPYVKQWLRETKGNKCEKCGWNKVNPVTNQVPLECNHKNGNSSLTTPENIELICPNCHSLTPTFRGLNKGNGRKDR